MLLKLIHHDYQQNVTLEELLCNIYFLSWIWHFPCLLLNGLKAAESPDNKIDKNVHDRYFYTQQNYHDSYVLFLGEFYNGKKF